MLVKRLTDAGAFLERAGALLLGDEARNNLMLGIASTLRDHLGVYDEHHLWLVEDGDEIVGAALRTPPFNLVVAVPGTEEVALLLADALHAEGIELPGVSGAVPDADAFSRGWEERSGLRRKRRMAQRIYKLTEVRAPTGVAGTPRVATGRDRPMLLTWMEAFAQETFHEVRAPADSVERMVDARLRAGTGAFLIWDNPEPVALAGWGGLTPNGARVGPVYTPPEHRRLGYGSAVTAAVTAERLAAGRRFCFLHTDLANPTSNRIYMNIGYEPVCDFVDYAFESA